MSKLQVDLTALSRAVAQAMSAQQSYEEVYPQSKWAFANSIVFWQREAKNEYDKLPEWLVNAEVITKSGDSLVISKGRVLLMNQQNEVLYKQDF